MLHRQFNLLLGVLLDELRKEESVVLVRHDVVDPIGLVQVRRRGVGGATELVVLIVSNPAGKM